MKKRNNIIAWCIGIIVLILAGWGITYFIMHINGTTSAQIESRQKANDAMDQTMQRLSRPQQ